MKVIVLDTLNTSYKVRDAFYYSIIDEETYSYIYNVILRESKYNNLVMKYDFDYDIINTIIKEIVYLSLKNYIRFIIESIKSQQLFMFMDILTHNNFISEHIFIKIYDKEFITKHFYINDHEQYILDKIISLSIRYVLDRILTQNRQVLLSSTICFIQNISNQVPTIEYNYIRQIEMTKDNKIILICS